MVSVGPALLACTAASSAVSFLYGVQCGWGDVRDLMPPRTLLLPAPLNDIFLPLDLKFALWQHSPPSRHGPLSATHRPETAPLVRPITRGIEGSERGFYSDILGTDDPESEESTQGYLQVSESHTLFVHGLAVVIRCSRSERERGMEHLRACLLARLRVDGWLGGWMAGWVCADGDVGFYLKHCEIRWIPWGGTDERTALCGGSCDATHCH